MHVYNPQVGNPYSSCSDTVTEYNRIDFDDQNEYVTFYSSKNMSHSLVDSSMFINLCMVGTYIVWCCFLGGGERGCICN